jgi:GNAT superfamily N-acetyltransferase
MHDTSSSVRIGPLRIPPPIRIRRIDHGDRAAVSRFYAALSPESRLCRFLGASNGIPDLSCRVLCSADHDHEEGFVAVPWSADGPDVGQIVGHLCLVRVNEFTVELAIAVADQLQGRGIGRLLFEAGLAWADLHQIETVTATAFARNGSVIGLLTSTPGARVQHVGAGLVEIEIPIDRATRNAA